MKKFDVLLSETAVKQFKKLESKTQRIIKTHLKELSDDPFTKRSKADIKELKGFRNPDLYRLRIGKFRVIYTVIEQEVKVTELIRREKGYSWID